MLPPPVIALAMLAGAAALQRWKELGWLSLAPPGWRVAAGVLLMMGGLLMINAGRRALKRNGTNVNPFLPSLAIVTTGIYSRTRNPIYGGGLLLLLGIALFAALDWLLVLFMPGILLLHFGVVRREERYLERKFGAGYRTFKASVRRYL